MYAPINVNTFTVGGSAHTSESVGGGECSGDGDTGTCSRPPNTTDEIVTTNGLEGAQSSGGSTEDDRTSLKGKY